MALFKRETLAEVFWEGQHSSYTPWWGESEFINGLPPESDEVYQWPYPVKLWEVDEYGQKIQVYLLEAHDIEAAIIKYADTHNDESVCDIIENMDVVICDDILQLACFNEIRYA